MANRNNKMANWMGISQMRIENVMEGVEEK